MGSEFKIWAKCLNTASIFEKLMKKKKNEYLYLKIKHNTNKENFILQLFQFTDQAL